MQYRKDAMQIKLAINYKANLENCEYDKYIQHLLDHISGAEEVLRFTNKNQFDFVYLCEVFKVSLPLRHLMNHFTARTSEEAYHELHELERRQESCV